MVALMTPEAEVETLARRSTVRFIRPGEAPDATPVGTRVAVNRTPGLAPPRTSSRAVPVASSSQAPGGRLASSVYRRRRLVAGAAVALVLSLSIAVLSAAGSALARTGGGPLTTTGGQGSGLAPVAAGPGGARVWIVRPGDTLWGIATSLEPGRDVRPLVDQLQAEVGSSPLQPGEAVPIPASR